MNHCSGQSKASVEDVGTREEKSVLSFPTPYSACQAMQEQEVVGSEGAGGAGAQESTQNMRRAPPLYDGNYSQIFLLDWD